MKKEYQLVGIASVMHLLVDGLCICCMYLLSEGLSLMPEGDGLRLATVFLIYNSFAFISQPLTGAWIDRMRQPHWMLLAGVMLMTLGVAMASLSMMTGVSPALFIAVAMLLGMGNSCFHVWGGKQTVIKAGNDIRVVGVFVSTGAFGLAIGGVFCEWILLYAFLLLICVLAGVYLRFDGKSLRVSSASNPAISSFMTWVALVALMAVVMFRSFVAQDFSSGIEKGMGLILALGLTAMLGKMAGGWLAKAFGIVPSMVGVLTVVLVCMLLKESGTGVLLIGVFAMNCTMAVTLWLANEVLKGREGLAFGLLAAALIPGWLLAANLYELW